MALPCVLFSSSSSDFSPSDIVKRILDVDELPTPNHSTPEIKSYEWHIDTKYYRTKVHLCTTDSRTIGDEAFAESVEAFIHFFDPNVPSSFELANAWLSYLTHIEPEVQMLVCKSSSETDAVSRHRALGWCIDNGFELVELEPQVDSDDEDNDFPETTGLARIIQALHSHTWPNLEMKDSPPIQSTLLRQMMKEQQLVNRESETSIQPSDNTNQSSCADNVSQEHSTPTSNSIISATPSKNYDSNNSTTLPTNTNANSNSTLSTTNSNPSSTSSLTSSQHSLESGVIKPDSSATVPDTAKDSKTDSGSKEPGTEQGSLPVDDIEWGALVGAMASNGDATNDDQEREMDDFEQLFTKLKVMKDRAGNLPISERRKYAEKVAMSFWNAIGGDPDEIGDLGSDSD